MDNIDLSKYQTFVFDCDGVVLDSNKIKTQAFYDVASVYGHDAAQELQEYHVQNGGISRYAKFEYLLTYILKKELLQDELNTLLESFAEVVKKALLTCDVADGLKELRKKTKHAKWLIVSGGDQEELREVFAIRGLDDLFDGGVFGSPDVKEKILNREVRIKNIVKPGVFLGDSKYDYQVSSVCGLDFIFLSEWTEVQGWHTWVKEHGILYRKSVGDLCV